MITEQIKNQSRENLTESCADFVANLHKSITAA